MRRRLLLQGSAALALVVAGGLVWRGIARGAFVEPAGEPFTPWDLWQAPEIKGTPLALVAAGILASNPHNTQPWLFRVRDTEIEVLADTRRNLGSFDPYLREAHIGLGCAIENMVLAAPVNGLTATVQPDPGSLLAIESRVEPVRAAIVKLGRAGEPAAPTPLYAAIPRRHTNRYGYARERPLPAKAIDAFKAAVAEPQLRLFLFDTGPARQQFDAAAIAATEEIVADKQMIEDSHGWFRDGPDELARERSGLTLDTAGLSPLLLAVAKMLPMLPAEQSHKQWLTATRETHLPSAPLTGLIAVRDRYDRPQALLVGRLWQRMHLAATTFGIAMHPINQPVETVDRERQLGREAKSEARLAGVTGAPEWKPTFAFRAGFATRAAPRSARRALTDVTANA
jgi:nitroreductase